MNFRKTLACLLPTILLLMPLPAAEAGAIGKAAARGAAKSVSKSVNKGLFQKLRRDLLRDRKTSARLLQRDRHVFRYTTKAQAQQELRSGLRPGTHTTVKATAGRPPNATNAQQRYGLPKKPQVRETVHLTKGQPVRINRALGGGRGVGEMTSTKRLPPGSVEKVVPLR